MTPELKPCPACGGVSLERIQPNYIACADHACRTMGPSHDPDGAKWNALPRHTDPPRDGARLRKLREWVVVKLGGSSRLAGQDRRTLAAENFRDVIGAIDKLLAEPEPPAAVQVPEDARKWARYWTDGRPAFDCPENLLADAAAQWILSLPTAPASQDAEVERLRAQLAEALPFMQALKSRHNGYDAEMRASMGMKEPASAEHALDELLDEERLLTWKSPEPKKWSDLHEEVSKCRRASSKLGAENGRLRTALQVLVAEMARQGGGRG